MTNLIGIYNHTTSENIVREMTLEEQAQRDAEIAAFAEAKTIKQTKADENAAKRTALLTQLGITEEQAKLLLS
jgi:hypothetical protein